MLVFKAKRAKRCFLSQRSIVDSEITKRAWTTVRYKANSGRGTEFDILDAIWIG